jgi:DNA-binding XRE family transcriptional regulator
MNTIHRIECGRAVPDLALAGRMAEALDTDIAHLFPELLPRQPAA